MAQSKTDTLNLFEYFENNTLRLEVSHRGGGIEIDAAGVVPMPGAKMTAYQNYLGGGMTGAVCFDCNIRDWQNTELAGRIGEVADALKRYFYALSNDEVADWDEWAASPDFEAQQTRPESYPGL